MKKLIRKEYLNEDITTYNQGEKIHKKNIQFANIQEASIQICKHSRGKHPNLLKNKQQVYSYSQGDHGDILKEAKPFNFLEEKKLRTCQHKEDKYHFTRRNIKSTIARS
jgi:hypothetical protein